MQLVDNPYLSQHINNPINWQCWENEVLENAKKEEKLILLSIGYSTCHWCHVMNREVFNDPEVGDFINEHFIAIKLDREEFPDVDEYFMNACQVQNGSAGWPLNCILSPEALPLVTVNYMPKNKWMHLIQSIQHDYKQSPSRILDFAHQFKKALKDRSYHSEKNTIYQCFSEELIQNIEKKIDREYGGAVGQQKFMMPSFHKLIIELSCVNNEKYAVLREYSILTLNHVALNTIFDSVHGGIFRYSTSPNWNIPHFEKMLYDQAQMISLFSLAFHHTKSQIYKEKAHSIFEFCIKYLKSSNSVFYSAIDAESNGKEGYFYSYSYAELKQSLSIEELHFLELEMKVSEKGNWENSLNLIYFNRENYNCTIVESILNKLKTLKSKDSFPFIDKKIQLSWNALMIIALCDSYKYLGEKNYLSLAIEMVDFIESNLFKNNVLNHSIYNNKLNKNCYLEDYVYYIQALRMLNTVTGNYNYEKKAKEYFYDLFKKFEKDSNGIFYKTGAVSNFISIESFAKLEDDIMPSPNGILQSLLNYFGLLECHEDWLKQSDNMKSTIYNQMIAEPLWYSNWILNELNQLKNIVIKISGKDSVWSYTSIVEKIPCLKYSIQLKENQEELKISICTTDRCLEPIFNLEDFFVKIEPFVTIPSFLES